MEFAEKWIKKQKCNKTALHVNYENKNALKLYKKLGYSEYEIQYIKKLSSNSQYNLPNDRNFSENIQMVNINDGLNSIKNILFKNFKLKFRSHSPKEIILTRFQEYINLIKNAKEEYEIYVYSNINEKINGYFILYMTEWRYNECVWIKDLGFLNKSNTVKFFPKIYSFIENWARKKEIPFIEIVLSKNQLILIDLCNQYQFETVGYFMEKNLN